MKMFLVLLLMACTLANAAPVELNINNTATLRGEVNDDSVGSVMLKLGELEAARGEQDYPLYLVLDSPGGDIEAGNMFIEYAKTIKNLQTVSIFAASMASAIAQSLPGKRLILNSGTMMFHRARGSISGQVSSGELEVRLKAFQDLAFQLESRNASRMNMELPLYKALIKDEYWISGAAAVSSGAADATVSIKCDAGLVKGKEIQHFNTMFGQIDVQFSMCPLIRMGTVQKDSQKEAYRLYTQKIGAQNAK